MDGSRRPLIRAARPAAILLSAWMLIWVPVIVWGYGPQNFLWLCNVALFLILYALWSGDRLVVSSQAGTVVLIGALWTADFALGLATGGRTAVITAYMWNPDNPLPARAASLYHVFVPLIVLWTLARWGYDRRGPWLQCVIGGLAVVSSWLFTDADRNINWVHSPFHVEQRWLTDPVWVAILVLLMPLAIYWTGHRLVRWILNRYATGGHGSGEAGDGRLSWKANPKRD